LSPLKQLRRTVWISKFKKKILQDRLCGDAFGSVALAQSSGTVVSQVRPFRVGVHFDGFEALVPTSFAAGQAAVAAQFNNRGFCLSYVQQPCTA